MKAWEMNVRRTVPYVPGEQPQAVNLVKLNTNENPYPPAPGVAKVLRETDADLLRRYPDPAAGALVRAIADFHGVAPEQVFVGVGSDDVLGMAFLTFFAGEKPILFPDITYSFYDVWADLFRIPYRRPALDENFRLRPEDYLQENGGIVIANPNAPTSIAEPLEVIERIAAGNPGSVVIVDEAYVDFGGQTALPLTAKYDNVLVVRTFSKSRSLAGLRIGYAIGCEALIRALQDIKYSYNSYTMNAVTIAAGCASVEDRAYFEETLAKVVATRETAEKKLRELGFTFPESSTNFLFATHETVPADYIFAELRRRQIYVRYFPKPRIDRFLRITVGTPEEMDRLCEALGEIISAYRPG
ncbi:MAG: histidinol-phosphate transaminase [Lachnospiraceae bacterium]|nr:histidinol-phosphate transaminase [Lachnospiraceae bacterium]MBQ9563820.1 histidinol-phosphate transaminase [Lachnospiraceae bacterium]